jgi:hypothetical protein
MYVVAHEKPCVIFFVGKRCYKFPVAGCQIPVTGNWKPVTNQRFALMQHRLSFQKI